MQTWTFPLVLGTGILLGLGNPLARWASLDGISTWVFTLWPTALAGLVLLLAAWVRHGARAVDTRLLSFGLIAGVFGHALPMLCAYWLAAHAGAGFASLSFTLSPVFTLAIMGLLGRERLRPLRLLAVIVGMGGGLLLVGGQVWSLRMEPVWVAMALLVPTLIAATNVYRSLHMPRTAPDTWLSAATLIGSALLLILLTPWSQSVGLGRALPAETGAHWLLIQAGVLMAAYLCYFALQRRAEPVAFSLIGYVMMLVSVGMGVTLFGEQVAWTLWPAVVLIALALWMMNRYPAKAVS